jgi:hypothetical protein
VDGFVDWYNGQNLQSRIKYMTLNNRHYGQADVFCAIRQESYTDALAMHPQRWS